MSDPWGKKMGGDAGGFEEMLGALGGGRGPGGLDGLLDQLRSAGLGPQLDSWIGTGSNAPVEPDDMRRAFGDDQLHALGGRMGMGSGALAAILAQVLPMLIDRMSPQGQMPQGQAGSGGLGGILGGILGGGGLGAVLGSILGGGDGGAQQGPGEEVAPPPERGYPGKPMAGGHPEKPGYSGKPAYPGKPGYGGKPGWPQEQAAPQEDGGGGSDDPLSDLARSADRLRGR